MDRGDALAEYAALILIVVSLAVAATAYGPGLLPRELGSAVHRALGEDGSSPGSGGARSDGDPPGATTGHEPPPEGDWGLDTTAAADALLRCARGVPVPDPVGRVDCALALLGLLDSQVLEVTILRLEAEELHELFLSRSFTATGAARAAVRLLWEHASEETLRRLSRTRTFGFLQPFLESSHRDWALLFVSVGGDYMRATIEQNTESPRRTIRHHPLSATTVSRTPPRSTPPAIHAPRRSRDES